MRPSPETFDELAQSVLRNYLRSALIIDDQWPEGPVSDLKAETPDESALIDDQSPDSIEPSPVSDPTQTSRPPDNPEDAQLLTKLQRALLKAGLLATGIRYSSQNRDLATRLASCADIVVLDWHLVGDEGSEAIEILKELQGQDLRFICIFTGHGRISEIRRTLENGIGTANSSESDGDLRIRNLVIAIRNKENLTTGTEGFTVGPDDLLEAALQGLAANYNGLVQLAMLELTQMHRRQLPAILERVDQTLDTAVLLEAGNEASPVDQGGAFLAVLLDEWRAHLEQENSNLRILSLEGRTLRGRQLAQQLGARTEEELAQILEETGVKIKAVKLVSKSRDLLQSWMSEGCTGTGPQEGRGITDRERPLIGWAALRAATGSTHEDSAKPLLRLDTLFHQQFEQPKELTQGTLVSYLAEQTGEVDYLLCITPRCDSARPEKIGHLFTFIHTKSLDPQVVFQKDQAVIGEFYCVVKSDAKILCLEFLLKQKLVLRIPNKSFDEEGMAQGYHPITGDEGSRVPLQRVAQLRMEHALSITAAASADGSRVGVNRVEFLRAGFR